MQVLGGSVARTDLSAHAGRVTDETQRSRLAAMSDRILEAIRALKAIELRKRQATPSTPDYHALTEDSAQKSREIFAAAAEQDRAAQGLKPGPTIEETAERERQEA